MTGITIIAEAGVNHNGSLTSALEMVDVAAEAGADVIKFQTFSADRLARRDASLAAYQRTSEMDERSQWDLLKGLELSHEEFRAVRERCDERGIAFLSTGFDLDELRFLIDELRIPLVKIASGDLTFAPLLVEAARSGLPTVLSTGMADLDEIGRALGFLAFGYALHDGGVDPDATPDADLRERLLADPGMKAVLARRVTVLHCTTQYPAPVESLNLRAMTTIAEAFELPVGYSDHSLGVTASTAAVALGAVVIEKHFTLDTTLEGPNHAASLDPDALRDFISALRDTETALGSPVKECQPVERANREVVRRSLVAARTIAAGATIAADDLECRRPASGRSAFEFWDVVGTTAARDYQAGDYVA
jgi:N-acetylneuraminate synthase